MPASDPATKVRSDGLARAETGGPFPAGRSPRWLEGADLRILAKLPLSAALAWLLPPHRWEKAARLTVGPPDRLAEKIGQILGGDWAGRSAKDIAHAHQLMLRLDQLAYLRCHAPWTWRPRLSLCGSQHLAAARSAGKGMILWVAPTVAGSLVAKMTLHGNGIAVHHLSHPDHGFSRRTRLGRRLLNPLRTRIEDRFLRERVLLGEGNQSQAALRRLSSLLRQGEAVSITVGPHGSRVLSTPFGGGRLEVASGAPALAARTGAALLPVWVWRRADNSYATRIEAPLVPAGDQQAIVHALGRQLERFAQLHPEQVQWDHGCLNPPAAPVTGRAG